MAPAGRGAAPTALRRAGSRRILQRRAACLEGPHRIAWALGEHRSTVWPVLGVTACRGCVTWTGPRARGALQRERPGELIHVDVKKQGRIPDGGGWRIHDRGNPGRVNNRRDRGRQPRLGYDYLHIAVDDRSRIAYLEAHSDERKDTAAAFIGRAVACFSGHDITVSAC